ncbi:MAG: single-stranded DNA-binding protein [Verrucomicrobiota bacterium]
MGSMNRVFLMGNLTRDPELRRTPTGLSVLDLRLAVNERFKNKAGEAVDSVCFADVVVWGRQAETCGQYLAKGSAVMVEGKLQFEQWQTPEGQKRSKLRIRANRVQFLGRPRRSGQQGVEPAHSEPSEASEPEPVEVADETPF